MALRGKKPTEIQKRLKLLLYGCAGVGKTFASIQFPCPYLIDTERGAEHSQYVEMIDKNNGAIFQSSDFDEILDEVKALLTEKHTYKTLVIDPLTTVYANLLDQAANKLKSNINPDGTAFGAHYGVANKKMKGLLNLLTRLDMNVIITSHSKNEYGTNLSVLGQTFDCYKKLDYLFDLALELRKIKGSNVRTGIVVKSRIKTFEESESFPFSYEEVSKRYGKDLIEKENKTEKLATEQQVKELKSFVELLKVPEEITNKWIMKANSTSFDEMTSIDIQKCIDFLKIKINLTDEK